MKKFNRTLKTLIAALLLIFTVGLFITSCDDDSTPYYYKLTLISNGGTSGTMTRGTTQIFYNPLDKSWYKNTDGKEKLTPSENRIEVPTLTYTATIKYVDPDVYVGNYKPTPGIPMYDESGAPVLDKDGKQQYKDPTSSVPVPVKFKQYKGFINEKGYIEFDNQTNSYPSIKGDTTIMAEWGDATVNLPLNIVDKNGVFSFVGYKPQVGNSTPKGDSSSSEGTSSYTLTSNETLYGVWNDSVVKKLTLQPWGNGEANDYTEIAKKDEGKTTLYYLDHEWSFSTIGGDGDDDRGTGLGPIIEKLTLDELPKKEWKVVFVHENQQNGTPGVDYPSDDEMQVPFSDKNNQFNRTISWSFQGYKFGTTEYISMDGDISKSIEPGNFVSKERKVTADWRWLGSVDEDKKPTISFKAPSAYGWRFDGFYSGATKINEATPGEYTFKVDRAEAVDEVPTITITAKWTKNKVFGVTLDSQNATKEPKAKVEKEDGGAKVEAEVDIPDGIFYATEVNEWYVSEPGAITSDPEKKILTIDGFPTITIPEKIWNITYNLGNSDIKEESDFRSAFDTEKSRLNGNTDATKYKFIFGGYEITEGSGGGIINGQGQISQLIKPDRNYSAKAKWTKPNQITLVNLEDIKKNHPVPGWLFVEWRDDVTGEKVQNNVYNPDDDNNAIVNRRENQSLTAIWREIAYDVTVKDNDIKYYGYPTKPIEGVKNLRIHSVKETDGDDTDGQLILLTINDSLEITGQDKQAEFEGLSKGQDITKWLINADGIIDNPVVTVHEVIADTDGKKKSLVINLEGSFKNYYKTETDTLKNSGNLQISISPEYIKNAKFATPIVKNIPYRVTSEVTLAIADNTEGDFRGTEGYPLIAVPNEKSESQIKITLSNGKFKNGLSVTDVKQWFENITYWFLSDLSAEILSGGSGEDTIVIRIIGTGKSATSGSDGGNAQPSYGDIEIPLSYIQFGETYKTYSITQHCYFIKTTDVEVHISDTTGYYGSSAVKPLQFVPGFYTGDENNTRGSRVRLVLSNKKFKNEFITGQKDSEILGWFDQIKETIGATELNITTDTTASSQNILELLISGYVPATAQPNNGVVTVTVPWTAIDGAIAAQGNKTTTLYFKIEDKASAKFDTVYKGAELSNPVSIPYYVGIANGSGEDIRINLERAKFTNLSVGEDVKSWFVFASNTNVKITSAIVKLIMTDQSSIIVSLNGYSISATSSDALTQSVIIPPDKLQNWKVGTSDDTDASVIKNPQLYYRTGNKPVVTIVEGSVASDYDNRIDALPYINVGERFIRLKLSSDKITDNKNWTDFKFSDTLTSEKVMKWFNTGATDVIKTVVGDVADSASSLKVEYVDGKGTDTLTLKMTGYAKVPNIQRATTFTLPYEDMLGGISSVDNTLKITNNSFNFYTGVTPVITLSNDAGYTGAESTNPMWLSQSYLIDSDHALGYRVKITLSSGAFRQGLTASDIEQWIPDIRDIMNVEDGKETHIDDIRQDANTPNVVEFRIHGYSNIAWSASAKELSVVIPFADIQNASADSEWQTSSLTKNIYYRGMADFSILTIEDMTGYYGSEAKALTAPEKTYFDDGTGSTPSGFKVRISNKQGYAYGEGDVGDILPSAKDHPVKFKTSSLAVGAIVTSWFKENSDVTIEKATIAAYDTNGTWVDVNIQGYFNSSSCTGFIKQQIPALVFENVPSTFRLRKGVVDTNGKITSLEEEANQDNAIKYETTDATSKISATISSETGYVGTSANKLIGTPYINFGSNNLGNKIKIQLKNAVFNDNITGELLKVWFDSFVRDVNNSKINFVIESGENTGVGKDNIVFAVTGHPTIGSLDGVNTFDIPYSVLKNVHESYEKVPTPLNVYYRTEPADNVEIDTGDAYFGSLNNPIKGTPYINYNYSVSLSGTPIEYPVTRVKLNITGEAKRLTFSEKVDSGRVAEWFKNFKDAVGGTWVDPQAGDSTESNDSYTIKDPSTGNKVENAKGLQSIIIEIKGYPTKPNTNSSTSIKIEAMDLAGAVDDFVTRTIPIYYQTSSLVSSSITDNDANFYGSQGVPLEAAPYISYAESENGLALKLNLQNARFDTAKLNAILSDSTKMNEDIRGTVIDIPQDPKDNSTRKYLLSSIAEDHIVIKVTGYNLPDETAIFAELGTELKIKKDYIKFASSALNEDNYTTKIFFKNKGAVIANVSTTSGFVGSSDSPLRGQPFINLGRSTNTGGTTGDNTDQREDGVIVRVELSNARFAQNLDNEMVKDIFSEITREYGILAYELDTTNGGGAGKSYIDVKVTGYANKEITGTVAKSLLIKYKHILAANPHGEMVTDDDIMLGNTDEGAPNAVNLYMATDEMVKAALVKSQNYGMNENNPLGVGSYKWMDIGGTNPVKIRIELTNGNFNVDTEEKLIALQESLAKSINDSDFKNAFSGISCTIDKTVLPIKGNILTVTLNGYAHAAATSGGQDVPIYIPYNYIQYGGPEEKTGEVQDDSQKLLITGARYDTTGLKDVSAVPQSEGTYVGSSAEKSLVATRYFKFGQTGDGVSIMLKFDGALFGGSLDIKDDPEATKNAINAGIAEWFKPLSDLLGGTVKFEYVDIAGAGLHTNSLLIRVTGAPNPTTISGRGTTTVKIPYSALDNTGTTVNENNEALYLNTDIYYNITDDVTLTISSAEGYYGSSTNPIAGTPYIKLGDGNGIKVLLTLNKPEGADITPMFKTDIQDAEVKRWFAKLNELSTGQAGGNYFQFDYSQLEKTTTAKSTLVVGITGHITIPNLTLNTADISVPITNFTTADYDIANTNTVPSLTSPVSYKSYDNLRISSNNANLSAPHRVYLGYGQGQTVTLTLTGGKFEAMTPTKLRTWFTNVSTVIDIGNESAVDPKKGLEVVEQKSEIIKATSASDTNPDIGNVKTTLTFRVKGAFVARATSTSLPLLITSNNIANAVTGLTMPQQPDIQYSPSGDYTISGKAYDSDGTTELTTVKFIPYVRIGSDTTKGIKLSITNDKTYFRPDLDTASVVKWLNSFNSVYNSKNTLSYSVTIGPVEKVSDTVDIDVIKTVDIAITGYPTGSGTLTDNVVLTIPALDTLAAADSKNVTQPSFATGGEVKVKIFNPNPVYNVGIRLSQNEVILNKEAAIEGNQYFIVQLDDVSKNNGIEFVQTPSEGVEVPVSHRVLKADGSIDTSSTLTVNYKFYSEPDANGKYSTAKLIPYGRINAALTIPEGASSVKFTPSFTFDDKHIKNITKQRVNGDGVILQPHTETGENVTVVNVDNKYFNVDKASSLKIKQGAAYSPYYKDFIGETRHPYPTEQQMDFYRLQGGISWPTRNYTQKIHNDFLVADIPVTGGFFKEIYTWATTSGGYSFDSSTTKYYGYNNGTQGTARDRNSAVDPIVGMSVYEMMVFCNAATEWYNAKMRTINGSNAVALTPVYLNTDNSVIKSATADKARLEVIHNYYPKYLDKADTTHGRFGADKTGFRLPTVGEYLYASSSSSQALSGEASYNETPSLPTNFYAQTYNAPSGYDKRLDTTSTLTNHESLKDYVIYGGLYSNDPGTQPVGKYITGADAIRYNGAKKNLLGLYDMSGNVIEITLGNFNDRAISSGGPFVFSGSWADQKEEIYKFNIKQMTDLSRNSLGGLNMVNKERYGLRLYRTILPTSTTT